MVTISVDDQINVANEIINLMKEIDPSGEHFPYSDVNEALAAVKEKLPDVAWLDIEMPTMSGLQMAMEVKKISPKTNIIFVTGHEKFAYQSFQLHASGFILKPATKEALERELGNLRNPIEKREAEGMVRVQCFGNFEIFDRKGQPVTFQRAKSKELLAYMIDRRGSLCSSGEICGILFEDREQDRALKNQLRVFMSKLRQDLSKAGIEDILIKGWNASGVDCSKLDCDFYNYLKGDTYAVNSFQGEYMSQYFWAEMTLGELVSDLY